MGEQGGLNRTRARLEALLTGERTEGRPNSWPTAPGSAEIDLEIRNRKFTIAELGQEEQRLGRHCGATRRRRPTTDPCYWIRNGADTSTAYGVVPFLSSCST
jgi:hypothetical protein